MNLNYSRPDESHPSALAALQKGLKLQDILKHAKSIQHKSIISFRNLRQDVYSELIDAEKIAGVKVN